MSKWRDMDSAPKDGTRILTRRPRRGVGISAWDDQRYNNKPRPYWSDDRSFFGVREDREDAPDGWMPLPDPDDVIAPIQITASQD